MITLNVRHGFYGGWN